MRFSDIKVQHCYNIIFDDVRACEFDGTHLGVVLKKNNDNKTVIVAPLTRQENGDNFNKKNIGKIKSLPTSLNSSDSYLVYNQVRTVNANRMMALKEVISGVNTKIDCNVEDDLFKEVLKLCSVELTKSWNDEQREDFYTELAKESRVKRIIDLIYQFKSATQQYEAKLSEDLEKQELALKIEYLRDQVKKLHNDDLPFVQVYSTADLQNNIPGILTGLLLVEKTEVK